MAGVDTDYQGEARPQPGIKVGYLPQEPQLDANKTVREAVEVLRAHWSGEPIDVQGQHLRVTGFIPGHGIDHFHDQLADLGPHGLECCCEILGLRVLPKFWGLFLSHNHTGALAASQSALFSYAGVSPTNT